MKVSLLVYLLGVVCVQLICVNLTVCPEHPNPKSLYLCDHHLNKCVLVFPSVIYLVHYRNSCHGAVNQWGIPMEVTKRRRAGHRAQVTSLISKTNQELGNDPPDFDLLSEFRAQLKHQKECLVGFDEEVQISLQTDKEVEADIETSGEYSVKIETPKRMLSWI